MIHKISLFLIGITFIYSCKKDVLRDEKEILVGTWNWVRTNKNYGCGPEQDHSETPLSTGANHQIVFDKSGIITFYTNGIYLRNDPTSFEFFQTTTDGCNFTIRLENSSTFSAEVFSKDSMVTDDFPWNTSLEYCENPRVHYFFKQ